MEDINKNRRATKKLVKKQEKILLKQTNSLAQWQKSIVKLTLFDRGMNSGKVLWGGCGVCLQIHPKDALLGSASSASASAPALPQPLSPHSSQTSTPSSSSRHIALSPGPASRALARQSALERKTLSRTRNALKTLAASSSVVLLSTRHVHPNAFSSTHCNVTFFDSDRDRSNSGSGVVYHAVELNGGKEAASLEPKVFHYTPELHQELHRHQEEIEKFRERDGLPLKKISKMSKIRAYNLSLDVAVTHIPKEARPRGFVPCGVWREWSEPLSDFSEVEESEEEEEVMGGGFSSVMDTAMRGGESRAAVGRRREAEREREGEKKEVSEAKRAVSEASCERSEL